MILLKELKETHVLPVVLPVVIGYKWGTTELDPQTPPSPGRVLLGCRGPGSYWTRPLDSGDWEWVDGNKRGGTSAYRHSIPVGSCC